MGKVLQFIKFKLRKNATAKEKIADHWNYIIIHGLLSELGPCFLLDHFADHPYANR